MGIELTEQEVLGFFFRAGIATYAGDMLKRTIVELPGSRVFRYARPPFLYVDCYYSVGEKSFGQAGIWHEAFPAGPVWGMQYRGWCTDKRVILFLKRALRAAYEQRLFVGGRGPEYFTVDGETLAYQNYPNRIGVGGFIDAAGKEEISDLAYSHSPKLFRHDYNCFALVHLSQL